MLRKLILMALSAGWLFCCGTDGLAQVVLSEIMYNPLGSESHDEFIEVVNLSETEPVDLTGWRVTDGEGVDTLKAVAAGLVLQPGQFGLILDPSYFENSGAYDAIIPATSLVLTIDNTTFGSRGLSNSRAETVSLINAQGDTVSQYTYTLGNAPGFSDEKIILSGPNTPENWADSRRVLGTPGGLNSVSPREVDLAISASDLAFSPEHPRAGETVVLSATVHNAGRSAVADFLLTLFEDVDGDSLPGPQDNIAGTFAFSNPLLPGDSLSVSAAYPEVSSGGHVFVARVEAPADQDTANN
ncbi:MAG: lamin tail domain-containing protein, partial [Calditrichaeota bacterium]